MSNEAWDAEDAILASQMLTPSTTETFAAWDVQSAADRNTAELVHVDSVMPEALNRIAACNTEQAARTPALAGVRERIPCESGAASRREWTGALRFVAALGLLAHQVIGKQVLAGIGTVGFSMQH